MKSQRILRIAYRLLAAVVLIYALWGIGRLVLDVNQPMGGFIWYYDKAVSSGWIVNWDTGLEWPAIGEDKLQLGDRILAIQGRPPDEFGEVYRATPLGAGITYRVLRDGQEMTISDVPVVAFTWSMFFQSQVVLFIIGFLYWIMGAFIHYVTPESEYSYAFSFFSLSTSLLTLSHAATVSVTKPFRPQALMFFFWKPIFGVAIVSCLYFATSFPLSDPDLPPPLSKRRIRQGAWLTGGALFALYVLTGLLPSQLQPWDARLYTLNLIGFVLSLLGCAAIFAYIVRTSESFIARRQASVMLMGWGLAAFPILLMWVKLVFPSFYMPSWNFIAFLEVALPLSIVYAILHYRLFKVQPYVMRILLYGLFFVGFVFLYVTVSLLLQGIPRFDRIQHAFTGLTYQEFDLRATLSTLIAAWVTLRLHALLRQPWMSPQSGLKARFPTILAHLCDQLDARHAYIALRRDDVFIVEATYNMPLPRQTLARDVALGQEPEIALKVPLAADDNGAANIGVIALGPKCEGIAYTPRERIFLDETVADLLTTSLRHVRQIERFSDAMQVSIRQVEEVREQERTVQHALTEALRVSLHEITSDEVKEALTLMRDARDDDLSALGELELAHICLVEAELRCRGIQMPTAHQRGQALKAVLIREIEAMEPESPQELSDEAWMCYLMLWKAFVRGQHWRQASDDLYVKRAAFFRWRDKAIEALTARLQNKVVEDSE